MDLDLFRKQLHKVLEALDILAYTYTTFAPVKKDLRWFGKGRFEAQLSMLCAGTFDAYNHGAALIGYFEGYDARGTFQLRIPQYVLHRDIHLAINQLKEMKEVVEPVFRRFCVGEPTFYPKGPTKPGPHRTLDAAFIHIMSLSMKLSTIVLGLIRNKEKQVLLRNHIDEIHKMGAL